MKFCPQCGSPLIPTMQGGRERLTCSAECGYVFWDNPVPVVAAVVELGDSVILIRNKEWPEKYLGIVAGFLEKDESPESGILRELKEELGLDGEIVGFIGNYAFPQKNQVVLAYHIKRMEISCWGKNSQPINSSRPPSLSPGPWAPVRQ
jgi:NADH pyrophosphatase NudC (nudix superfamily)